jgi:hypothetical protein
MHLLGASTAAAQHVCAVMSVYFSDAFLWFRQQYASMVQMQRAMVLFACAELLPGHMQVPQSR